MKLDMLFFLGIFYTVYGLLLVGGWVILGGAWNLYGGIILAIGIVLVSVRPKPPLNFFRGRPDPEAAVTQDVQCWCGNLIKSGQPCDHGEMGNPRTSARAGSGVGRPEA